MILDEIRIENWRNYKGEHIFAFNEGINLIVGPNGSGKTTLFEALWRTFFDRHSTNSTDIQGIRPIGTSLSPKSSIIFRHEGKRYKIEKQFLDHQYAKFYIWENGEFSLLHEQDTADRVTSGLLNGTLTGRGSTNPENRGLAEALWYLQNDKPLPDDVWNEGLQRNFDGIIDVAVESPDERRILGVIAKDYSENLTESKGESKKNTELYVVSINLDTKNRELLEARTKLHSTDLLREQLEQLISEENEKNSTLVEARTNKKKSDEDIKEAEIFERKKILAEAENDKANQKVEDLKNRVEQIRSRNEEITELKRSITEWKSQFSIIETKSNLARSAKEMYEAKWKTEIQPRLKVVELELEALETLEKIDSLNNEKNTLEKFLEKLNLKRSELNDKKKYLEELIAPSEKELEEFRQLSKELIKVESKLSVNSIRVGFKMKSGFTVVPDGKISRDNGEFILTEPSSFTIKKVGKVTIRGGTESLKELNERKDELSRSISGELKKYSAVDEMGLTKLQLQRNSLEQDVKRITKEVSTLIKERPDAEGELARVKREIIIAERKLKQREFPSVSKESTTSQIEVLTKEKRELINDIADAQYKEKEAFNKYEEERLNSVGIGSNIDKATAKMSALEEENARDIKQYGSIQGLENALREATKNQEEANDGLLSIQSLFDEKVTLPRKRAETIDRTLEQLVTRLNQVGKDIAGLKGKIEQIAIEGLYTRVADLENEIEILESRKAVLEKRDNARRLLRVIIEMFKTRRTSAIGAPIRKYVDPWLKQLSGGAFDSLSIDETLRPDFAILNDSVNKIPVQSLSYGTAEQVVVLVRLAIATILSQGEKNLVVLDDRLVNADPVKLQRMLTIIEEVSKRCQVVISTCEDSRYLGLADNVIRLPSGSRMGT